MANSRLPSSLYIHIPFCQARCSYCDFNIYAGMRTLYEPYVKAVCGEIEQAGTRLGYPRVSTLYFGGGTPSLLELALLERLVTACRAVFELDSEAEISLEANPGSLDTSWLAGLRELGVTRLSLGVQSAQADELALLRRGHSFADAIQSIQATRQAGFDNLNVDLIYGLPGQSLATWQDSLERTLLLEPEHLSLYGLSIEERTTLALWVRRGRIPLPDDDLAADMVLWADERLAQAAYARYEISNWARRDQATRRPGDHPRFMCRHNLTYWRNLPYLGFGAGAHSSFGGRRFWNVAHPRRYVERLSSGQSPQDGEEIITPKIEMAETVFLGLRLTEGISRASFLERFGLELDHCYGQVIERNWQAGLLEADERGIRLTRQGWLLGNRVFADFLPTPRDSKG
ncbi:MAG: radical SAM family heme chaperone HemW [Thermoflexales bacterium]|nr:radical SAM family heme chaperone HemW [Thermoflexales bacterium]